MYQTITKCQTIPLSFPPQCQPYQPGVESIMVPRPIYDDPRYVGSGKLKNKIALITGGDSGIGRAVAVAFAKEGADVAIVYLCPYESGDAEEAKKRIEELGQRCLLIQGDLSQEYFCWEAISRTIQEYGRIDVLVNNIGIAIYRKTFEEITWDEMCKIFRTNIVSFIYLSKLAVPYMRKGSSIINTASIVAYIGYESLIDYTASKGGVISFTRSLAISLADRGIRVNAVAPGPVWTPIIPSAYPPDQVAVFGRDLNVMKRCGQPYELAPAYVYLASDVDSSFVTGEVMHVNGGVIINS